jgi:hypothetical protein
MNYKQRSIGVDNERNPKVCPVPRLSRNHEFPVAFGLRVRRPGVIYNKFRFRRADAVFANMLYVPRVPAKIAFHIRDYTL